MTRIEENKKVLESVVIEAGRMPTGRYNEVIAQDLGVIAAMLADISKSLAILADKTESDE